MLEILWLGKYGFVVCLQCSLPGSGGSTQVTSSFADLLKISVDNSSPPSQCLCSVLFNRYRAKPFVKNMDRSRHSDTYRPDRQQGPIRHTPGRLQISQAPQFMDGRQRENNRKLKIGLIVQRKCLFHPLKHVS